MANATVGLRIDTETKARLKKLGKARDRSPHYLMKQAVEQFLLREEEIEAEDRLLNERWEKFQQTGESFSHDEAKAWVLEKLKTK